MIIKLNHGHLPRMYFNGSAMVVILIDWFYPIYIHSAYIEKLIDARVAVGVSLSLIVRLCTGLREFSVFFVLDGVDPYFNYRIYRAICRAIFIVGEYLFWH